MMPFGISPRNSSDWAQTAPTFRIAVGGSTQSDESGRAPNVVGLSFLKTQAQKGSDRPGQSGAVTLPRCRSSAVVPIPYL
jgi:hypothetical protein